MVAQAQEAALEPAHEAALEPALGAEASEMVAPRGLLPIALAAPARGSVPQSSAGKEDKDPQRQPDVREWRVRGDKPDIQSARHRRASGQG